MAILSLLVLVTLASGCSTSQVHLVSRQTESVTTNGDNRRANLERAARYPWKDDGRCAVRESSGDWAILVERCFDELDHQRIRFVDKDKACPVAQAGALNADNLTRLVGICLLVQPQLAVGAVLVVGTVIVAVAISEAIAEERRKLPCQCMCVGIDDREQRHGPYSTDRTKNESECKKLCLESGYKGGGFCRK